MGGHSPVTRFQMVWTLAAVVLTCLIHPGVRAVDAAHDFQLTDLTGAAFRLHRATGTSELVLLGVRGDDPMGADALKAAEERWRAFDPALRLVVIVSTAQGEPRASIPSVFFDLLGRYTVLHDPAGAISQGLGLTYSGDWIALETAAFTIARASSLNAKDTPRLSADIPAPDYGQGVSKILRKRCAVCHRSGGNAPFAMDSYARVRGWAPMMAEAVRTGRMPPWGADPEYGHFQDALNLSDIERLILLQWVEAGAPRGEGPDLLEDAQGTNSTDWPLGTPDQILQIPEAQSIPSSGLVEYQYFDLGLSVSTEDRWLRATHVRPTDPSVVHHALVFVREAGKKIDPQGEYMTSFLPGMGPQVYPAGTGKRIPAGAQLIVQLHYTTIGSPRTDQTQVGLYLLPEAPPIELRRMAIVNRDFEVPPLSYNYCVSSALTLDEDRYVYALHPHMHYRGNWMRYTVRYPDGREEVLLNVPHYDFYWQHTYVLEQPVLLPKGTVVSVRGAFDNSMENPLNPNPMATLRWGEESSEEMFVGAMTYSTGKP